MSTQNIFQRLITPDTPNVLKNERIYVYMPLASHSNIGAAAFDSNDFVISNGFVFLSTPVSTINANIAANASEISTIKTRLTNDEAQISANTNEIEILKHTVVSPFTNLGTVTKTAAPTLETVAAEGVILAGRPSRINDYYIWKYDKQAGYDTRYSCLYTPAGWDIDELPQESLADNDNYGVIRGTISAWDPYEHLAPGKLIVDLELGKVRDILVVPPTIWDYEYAQGVGYWINNLRLWREDVNTGAYVVGKANKAVRDQNNNIINETYADKYASYTKAESDAKYMSNAAGEIYYLANSAPDSVNPDTGAIVDNVPTAPADEIQFAVNSSSIEDAKISDCVRLLLNPFSFNKNSKDVVDYWLSCNIPGDYNFRVSTYAKKAADTNWTLLSAVTTGNITFTDTDPKLVSVKSIYSSLGSSDLRLAAGDSFRKVIEVMLTSTPPAGRTYLFRQYGGTSYPTSFNFEAQYTEYDFNAISGFKRISVLSSDWAQQTDESYLLTITPSMHKQPILSDYEVKLKYNKTADTYKYPVIDYESDINGNIYISSIRALDCMVLVASGLASGSGKSVMILSAPISIPAVDYDVYDGIKIINNVQSVINLTLPDPVSLRNFYTVFVSNDLSTSLKDIVVNGETISPGSGMQFKWNAGPWQVGEQPTDTDEVYDKQRSQLLTVTLNNLEQTKLTTDLGNVNMPALNEKVTNTDIVKSLNTQVNEDLTRTLRVEEAVQKIANTKDVTPKQVKDNLVILPVATNHRDWNLISNDFVLSPYQIPNSNQTLTEMLPPLTQDITIIVEKLSADGITNTVLELQADGTDLINGLNTPITITEDGIAGVLFNAGTTWQWLPYPILHKKGLVLSDDKGNVFVGDINVKFKSATLARNNEEIEVTPDIYNVSNEIRFMDGQTEVFNKMLEFDIRTEQFRVVDKA